MCLAPVTLTVNFDTRTDGKVKRVSQDSQIKCKVKPGMSPAVPDCHGDWYFADGAFSVTLNLVY